MLSILSFLKLKISLAWEEGSGTWGSRGRKGGIRGKEKMEVAWWGLKKNP